MNRIFFVLYVERTYFLMKLKPPKEQVFSPIKWQREKKLLKSMRLINDRKALHVLNREEIIA